RGGDEDIRPSSPRKRGPREDGPDVAEEAADNADEPALPEGYVLVNGDWPLHAEHDAWLIETEHMVQVRPSAAQAKPPRTARDTPAPDPP
ncbi:MAG TPA: hypothetical protein VE631_02600, partial [Alphaproteobacteria bacterium]|nr:hypothetical protein [Alphaproteobacteria bacterium]